MKIQQLTLKGAQPDLGQLAPLQAIAPHLVLVFCAPAACAPEGVAARIVSAFGSAVVIGCSTAGEIDGHGVQHDTLVVTAIHFETSRVISASTELQDMGDSRAAGVRLSRQLAGTPLKAVLVFGQGVQINGSALVEGMSYELGSSTPIFGGLAGDDGAFVKTWTVGPSGVSDHNVVAVGLAGDALQVGYGWFGGWQPFGPPRRVTRCEGNVLYELDGEPALAIYKRYLGDYAKGLPASGLLFPFAMLGDERNPAGLIRTILGIDEEQGSLTLAGEIHQGGSLKLMHASTDALVRGAENAARMVETMGKVPKPALALLVSCVGRKLAMGARVDEEVEAVAEVLGKDTVLAGFYSYGEISPFAPGASCKLHNQTMTIARIAET